MSLLLSKSILAAAAMFVGLTATASAAVLVQKAAGGVGTDDIFVDNLLWRDVTITSPAGIGTIGVGLYKLERAIDAGPITPLSTFCIEVDQFINLPSTYAIDLLSAALSADKSAAISRLWALRFVDAASTASVEFDGVAGATSQDRAAAFQLAIWDIEIDGVGGAGAGLGAGGFQTSAANPGQSILNGLVNAYLAIAGNSGNPQANLFALTSADSQNLIIPGSPNGGPPQPLDEPVPAPAPLALLGAALAGLAALRRRA